MRTAIVLLLTLSLYSASIDFTLRTIYLKPDQDVSTKINTFTTALEKQLDTYDWKFPHTDFNKIEINISINIDKSTSDKMYTGVITTSSGLVSETRPSIPLKKDVYFNEQDISFSMDYDKEPQPDKLEPLSIETIVMYYAYMSLGEIFDKLSYTDQKNFKLEGEQYNLKLYQFENILTNATERKEWNKRLELINSIRQNKNIEMRKINALIYNGVYFFNAGKKDRAGYFIEPIYDLLSKQNEIPEMFFTNNYYSLGELFALNKDPKFIGLLIEKDIAHENFYKTKLPKEDKPAIPGAAPDIERSDVRGR